MANKADLSNLPMKVLVKQDKIRKMFNDTLKGRSAQFATSLVNIVNSNQSLETVDQLSVIKSAMVAATLNLPIDPNLGYMWIVPYGNKATPQIGYKGYIQLAQRTGQYKSMNAIAVHEGELGGWNPLTEEFIFNPEGKVSDKVIGYVGYFKLINGFEKTVYWTKENMETHKEKFSKGLNKKSSPWNTDYDAMAIKTVLRNMLNKWGPMSTELETALSSDERVPQDSINEQEAPKQVNSVEDLLGSDPQKDDTKLIESDNSNSKLGSNSNDKEVENNELNSRGSQEALFNNIGDLTK